MSNSWIRQLIIDYDIDYSEWVSAAAELDKQESKLIEALPDGDRELFTYLKSDPRRGRFVIEMIIEKCVEYLQGLDVHETRRIVIANVEMLLMTIKKIDDLNLDKVYNELLADWGDEASYHADRENLKESMFHERRRKRIKITKRDLTEGENEALWMTCHSELEGHPLSKEIAIDVVIWKMLIAWLGAMTDEDVRASETDLFGANQLQLIQGSSGMVLGRSAIEARITKAADRYSGAPLNDHQTILHQTLVEELFPKAPVPLFWFKERPFLEKREERRSRKNPLRKNLKIRKVKSWRCDSCTREFAPGESDRDLIPWTFRPDKRVGARAEVTLRDKLPEQAYEESRFMCTCWEQQAGVLHPTFDSNLVTK
jgi:hypothetical protein